MRTFDDPEEWTFFARGNANLVYRYCGPSEDLHNKLLRLRLEGQEYDTKRVFDFVESTMRPYLKDVVEMELAGVTFSVDGSLNDGFGLLMPNVLPQNSKSIHKEKYFEVFENGTTSIIEIKPKWLRQTRRGCRNCAHHKLKHGQRPSFCSLELLDPLKIKKAAGLISGNKKNTQEALQSYLRKESNVFRLLASQQTDIELCTLTTGAEATPDLCLQMTLRDVTVFLTIESSEVTKVTVTDVDPKSTTKWQSWATTEKKLITQNMYSFHP